MPVKRLLWTLLIAMLAVQSAAAYEVRFSTINDMMTFNEIDDDLYTFSLFFEFHRQGKRIRLFEHAFTDSRNGLRFDETYLSIGSNLPEFHGWQPELEIGALYVGEGLFGQDAQNAVHRAIGNKQLELPYRRPGHIHGTLRLAATRGYSLDPRYSIQTRVELFTAPEFKTYATGGVRVTAQPHPDLKVLLGVGLRVSDVAFDPLEPWIDGFGPTYEIGFRLWDHVEIAWDYNAFGTEMQHVNLSYVWSPNAPRPGR